MIDKNDLVYRVKRFRYLPTRTVARLSIKDGGQAEKSFCYVLEDVVRPNGEKVYGETAIPAGTYRMTVNYSSRFKRRMIYVHGVANFEGIRIHPGLTEAHTHGCLLVSRRLNQDFTLARDRQCTTILEQLVDEADDHRKAWLIVEDEQQVVHLPDTSQFTGAKPVAFHTQPVTPVMEAPLGSSMASPPPPLPAPNNLERSMRAIMVAVIGVIMAAWNWIQAHKLEVAYMGIGLAGILLVYDLVRNRNAK